MDFPTAITLSPEKAAQNIRMLPCWLMWPINKILYADIRVKGIISSLWKSFFSIIRESFFLAHVSFSPSAFADSIPHVGHSKRRGKILPVIATGWQRPQQDEKKSVQLKARSESENSMPKAFCIFSSPS